LPQPSSRVGVLPIVLLALGAAAVITIGVIYLFSSSRGGPPGIEPALANAPEGQLAEAVDRWYTQKLEPLGWRAQGPPGPSYVLVRSNNDELFLIYSKDSGVVTEFQRDVKVGRC
jgi:hypothetical protein